MDISGYPGSASARKNGGRRPSYYDPKRKPGRRRPLSLLAQVVLLAACVAAAWAGISWLVWRRVPATTAVDRLAQGEGLVQAQAAADMNSTGSGVGSGVSGKVAAAAAGSAAAGVAAVSSRTEQLMQQRIDRAMRLVPSYRGPGKAETFPHFANANRLLLATHSRLMWYRYDTNELKIIHEGEGVYYGAFPGEERDLLGAPSTLWVVSRPHNWRPTTTQEFLLHLDMESGKELGRVQIESKFTHDAVRRRDRVYVCNTGEGKIVELTFPGMQEVRTLPLFSLKEHVNTLAPTADGKLWAVLHNLGSSALVELDLASGQELRRLPDVGDKAHGLVFWDRWIVMLDSDAGALVRVDPGSGAVEKLWRVGEAGKYLKGLCVVDDIAFFGIATQLPRGDRDSPDLNCELAAYDLKAGLLLWRRQLPTRGLLNIVAAPHLVVESTTYSINTIALITYRDKPGYAEALAAAKLAQQQEGGAGEVLPDGNDGSGGTDVQARRQQQEGVVEPRALTMEAAAGGGVQQQQAQAQGGGPGSQAQQQQQGQQQQQQRREELDPDAASSKQQQEQQQEQQQAPVEAGGPMVARAISELETLPPQDQLAQVPPVLDPVRWSSGLPRLLLSIKDQRHGLASGAQLQLFRTEVWQLKSALQAMPDADWGEDAQRESNAFITGRSGNLNTVKPGARSIMLIFSDGDGNNVLRFPWYDRFKQWVEPWLIKIIGRGDLDKIMRLQFAIMPPRSSINRHFDSGGYSKLGHRIHVVVQSNSAVSFHVCDTKRGDGGGGGSAASDADSGTDLSGCVLIHAEEGLVFELNNRLAHYVDNESDQHRIHMIVDVAETPRQQRQLRVGEVCDYASTKIICPEDEEKKQEAGGEEGAEHGAEEAAASVATAAAAAVAAASGDRGGGDTLRRRKAA